MWLRMRKSSGRKRQVWPFQCTPAPPTPLPGRKLPHLRIGSAVCDGLFRIVSVSCRGRRKTSWRTADVEISGGVAPRAAFDRDDLEAGAGEFVSQDRSGPAETDDRDILAWETAGHQR